MALKGLDLNFFRANENIHRKKRIFSKFFEFFGTFLDFFTTNKIHAGTQYVLPQQCASPKTYPFGVTFFFNLYVESFVFAM